MPGFPLPSVASVDDPRLLTAGESTIDRLNADYNNLGPASGTVQLTFFTALRSETINFVAMVAGSGGSATLTLAKMGLYVADASGNCSGLVATASDTTLFNTANTIYKRALLSPFAKFAGQRYAVAVIEVGTTTGGIFGTTVLSAGAVGSTTGLVSPVASANLTGQADLPASIAAGSLSGAGVALYTQLTPS